MGKLILSGMKLHQNLSFSPLFLHFPKAEAVFWPGCALMNLDTAILQKCLELLRRAEPKLELCCGCCGQPSMFLFPEQGRKQQALLTEKLKQQGIRRIYTACPNCTLQLRQLEGFEVKPIWPLLAQCCRKDDVQSCTGSYVWHDPCATKRDPEQQAAVRQLLALCSCDYCEPLHSGSNSICCGNFHMLHISQPDTSKQLRQRRVAEFADGRIVLSSCEGCLSAFRQEGRQGLHLLELLFGESKSRGWGNRLSGTLQAKTAHKNRK